MKAILISADGLSRMMDVPDNRTEIVLPLTGYARTHPWHENAIPVGPTDRTRKYILFKSDRMPWMEEDVLIYREAAKEL